MAHEEWRLGFHLMPPEGWLNDPNGLCQFRGIYHVFFQYAPAWPSDDMKYWGHFTSPDLIHWANHGVALSPDIAEDRSGVFSGSAYVDEGAAEDGGDLMRLYYTGNVELPGNYDRIHEGREANEILVTSQDGLALSRKTVLLRNSDYPAECTLHVRDPKVWSQNDMVYMLLGARDMDDTGFCLLYESADGDAWRLHHEIRPDGRLGYMWECPNIVQLDGRDYLAVCPQGLPKSEFRWHNRWQSGYFPLSASILETEAVDVTDFIEWDYGYDFYAPQVFVDDTGRTILIGWMGTFDHDWTSVPEGLSWCHCLTVPREITCDADGFLRQWPVAELEALRGEPLELIREETVTLPANRADITLENIAHASGELVIGEALQIVVSGDELIVRFLDDAAAAGRPERHVPLAAGDLNNLRVLVDASAVEVYANEGETVISTRWFPPRTQLTVRTLLEAERSVVYPMEDAMLGTYIQ